MSNSNYSYNHIPFVTSSRKRHYLWILAAGLTMLTVVNLIAIRYLRHPYNILDNYQPLNSLSPVHKELLANISDPTSLTITSPTERAVVTTLYSEAFVSAALTLGRSLQNVHISARRIILYLPERLSSRTLCLLQEGGWELLPIVRIPPPDGGRGVHHRFADQYSKLQLWTLDKHGINSVIYLDGDTLVRQNFDELWSLPFEFAAVPDVYEDSRGFSLSFNAGMMCLRTSSKIYDDMLRKIGSGAYRRLDAEQGFLNMYFAAQATRLPHIYNANLVIKQRSPALWRAIEKDIRIIHYTMMKPFIEADRSQAIKGLWEAELEQWEMVWNDAFSKAQDKC